VRRTCEKREDILDWLWTGGKISPMTKGGSVPTPSLIHSASDRQFQLPYFEYSYDKVSDKN
jgi:hypothetical protein